MGKQQRRPKQIGQAPRRRNDWAFVTAVSIAVVGVGMQAAGWWSVSPWSMEPPEAPMPKPKPQKLGERQQQQPQQQQRKQRQNLAAMRTDQPHTPFDAGCIDDNESCENWAKGGECDANPVFMKQQCRASCHVCNGGKPPLPKKGVCEDRNSNCATWAAIGECQSNPGYMLQQCPVTCKMCQSDTCRDEADDCTERCRGGAASNYSENLNCYYEPKLLEQCAWTCGACKEHRFDRPQCKRAAGAMPAATPGSVNKIFNRIVEEVPGVSVLSRDPWVLTIDDFLTAEESEAIKQAGSTKGTSWARSQAGDGVQAARTSSTAWCRGDCLRNPTIMSVEQRVSDLLGGIPMENAEPMQVLRYEMGQFYKVHHDQNSPRSSAWGPRMFTVFMYIGDGYTGGETHFPRLNLTIPPGKGRACLWTSVLDSDPYQRDDRTDHESLPVESGVKFGVNYWIHMYPFRSFSGKCENQAYIQNWH
jgi:prolyl 4-hydroxylase